MTTKSEFICKLHEFDGELAARVIQPFAHACNTERLARRSAAQDIWRGRFAGKNRCRQSCHVPKIGDAWVVVRQYGRREWFYF